MPYFLCRLQPPRPSFPRDITPEEKRCMDLHGAYWRRQADRGMAVAVGPVMDPAGAWGLAIAEVADADEMRDLVAADPAVAAGLGFRYDIHPMPSLILREAPKPASTAP